MGKFWEFRNSGGGNELLLYGDIAKTSWFGDEVTASAFAADLAQVPDAAELTVRINSAGGDVFAAQAIGNMLEARAGHTTARLDGLCASAATIVACHCDEVSASLDSTYMIHPVSGSVIDATASEMRTYADALEKVQSGILSLYSRKSGKPEDEVKTLVDAETWWTAAEAKENGFVDNIVENVETAVVEDRNGILFVNHVNSHMAFDKAPEAVRNRKTEHAVEQEEDKSMEVKTVEELKAAYPELVAELENAAVQSERSRIQEIEEMALPGSETLTAEAKFGNVMTAEAYAKEALKEVRAKGSMRLEAMRQEADASGANNVPGVAPVAGSGTLSDTMANAKKDAAIYLASKKNGGKVNG